MINVFPRATEKAYAQTKNNIYIFDVPTSANKQAIVAAIEDQYKVKIVNIKTLVQNGKAVRASRGKHAQPATIVRSNTKKAYVTLAEGDSIKVFDETPAVEPQAKVEKEKK